MKKYSVALVFSNPYINQHKISLTLAHQIVDAVSEAEAFGIVLENIMLKDKENKRGELNLKNILLIS